MESSTPLIRNISDTALLAAVYRAREIQRRDALFQDPLAAKLAGERGEKIAEGLPFSNRHTWSWITRTYLFDQFITEQVQQGVDVVINLAAGLDARPYRMPLPSSLTWVEIDLPGILDYKDEVLEKETPICKVERVRMDLGDTITRTEKFNELNQKANKTLILSEGLLMYLTTDQVKELAMDLASQESFAGWVIDLISPGLLKMLQENIGGPLSQGGASLKFAPEEGIEFFNHHGWKAIDVRALLKTAAKLKRLSLWMRLLSLLPEPKGPPGERPWSGVCLLEKR